MANNGAHYFRPANARQSPPTPVHHNLSIAVEHKPNVPALIERSVCERLRLDINDAEPNETIAASRHQFAGKPSESKSIAKRIDQPERFAFN